MNQFDDDHVAAKLFVAATSGVPLDMRSGDPALDDPENGASWEAERTVSAKLIAELLTARASDGHRLRRLWLQGARVDGTLDLEASEVPVPIVLEGCFVENLVIADAELASLRLRRCVLEAGLDGREVRVRGTLELNGGFKARNASVRLSGAFIGGRFDCAGGHFENPRAEALLFEDATIGGRVALCDGFVAEGEVRLSGARIGGDVDCSGGRFSNPPYRDGPEKRGGIAFSAGNAKVAGNAIFGENFTAAGEVRLTGTHISGNLLCSGGQFNNPREIALSAGAATIDGSVFCRWGFSADGEVFLTAARIRGDLDCTAGQFSNQARVALWSDRAIIGGGVFCQQGFFADGQVNLLGAHIAGDLGCDGGRFRHPDDAALVADATTIDGSMHCRCGFEAQGTVLLTGAQIGGELGFAGTTQSTGDRPSWHLGGAKIARDLHLEPSTAMTGWIDLTNSKVGRLHDNPHTWQGGYELRGLTYETLSGYVEEAGRRHSFWRRDPVVKARLSWLHASRSGYHPQIYDQLANAYRAGGDEARARRVLIDKQRRRRRQLSPPARAWSLLEDGLVAYGYRSWQALLPFLVCLVAGALFFDAHRHDIVGRYTVEHPQGFNPIAYTLDLLLPVVNLTQRDSYTAHHSAAVVATALVVVGWVLTTAIVAALTGLVRRSS
jgi:hypothetical protein